MGKQIATYNNKVKQLVPGYDLKSYSPGTITVTRNSVENEQYASWSQNEDEQGMYIDGYSIGDGKTGYSSNQLVAMVDLYYRYLSPINGENYEGGERPYQLGDDGCIEIDNLNKTIEKGASYEFTLTPKSGFSMVPAGHIEVKDGSNWSSIDISWQNTEGAVNITIPSDKITGNLRFVLNDCLYKLYIQKTVDGHNYGDPEEIGIQNCSDTVNVDSLKPAEDPTGTHFVNITKDGAAISSNQQFCGDTTLNMNYAINQYTIDTSGVNSDCVNVILSPNVQTIEHGESLTITLTPKEGKRNIGAGSITMGNTAVRTWTSERSITETISSVEGDVVVIASCGEEDTYTITVSWVDRQTTLHTETYVVQSGATITPEDYVGDWTLPEGYYINSMSPAEGTTILVDSDKTITYDCRLYEYNINFVAGDGITLNSIPPQYALYGESLTINDVYEINQGYRSATETHTGNAGVSLDNGNVTVTNVKSDVTITISASQVPSYYVSFAFDDSNAGTLDPDRVQVLEDGCAEIEYTLNEYYTLDSIDTEGPGTETHTSNTIEICDVTGDVTVTINTNYNPPAETHRVTYKLSEGGIHLYRDGEIIQSDTAYDIVEDGDCSEMGYVLVEGYQFNEATSSVPSITPTVDTTNRTVEVCPTSDVTITLSTWRPTITYDIYEDGVKIDTQTQIVGVGGTATLQYRKSNTEDYVNPPTVSSNDPNLTVNVVKYTNRGYTITGTPVTQDATISLYLVTKSEYTVTFEVYKDGTLDSSDGWTSNYTEGETFDDETFTYDDSSYEINDVISQELTVDYSHGDSGEIIISTETPITENATVEIYLNSTHNYRLVNISSSPMDAMGGVVLTATLYDSVTGSTIYDDTQNNFELKSINGTNVSTKILTVYDHEDGKTETKTVVLNKTNPEKSNVVQRNIVVAYKGEEKTISSISQRAEVYGYYSDLSAHTWVDANSYYSYTDGWLLDYGDGQGCTQKDKYNLDTTSYNEAGQQILENPIDNGIYQGPQDYASDVSGNKDARNRNYHMSWIKDNDYRIFTSDTFGISSSICGDELEWTSESVGISTDYTLNYSQPLHCYGRTSINYYEVDDDFKFSSNSSSYKYSYPKHILFKTVNNTDEFNSWSDIYQLGYPTTSGQEADSQHQETTRWTDDVNDIKYDYDSPVTAHGEYYNFSDNNSGTSRGIYAYYTFLSPEVCVRDSNNNVVRDISDALEITNYETQDSPITTKYNTISSDYQSQDYDWDDGNYLENSDGARDVLCLRDWEKSSHSSIDYYYPINEDRNNGYWWFFDDGSGKGAKDNGTVSERSRHYYYRPNKPMWSSDELRVVEVASQYFGVPVNEILPDSSLRYDLGGTNESIVDFNNALKSEFGFDSDCISQENLDNPDYFATIWEAIEAVLNCDGIDTPDPYQEIQVNDGWINPYYYHKNNTENFSFYTNTSCTVTYDGNGTMTIENEGSTSCPGSITVDGERGSYYVTIDSGADSCGGDVTVESANKSLRGTIGGSENASDNTCDSGYVYSWEQLEELGCNVD